MRFKTIITIGLLIISISSGWWILKNGTTMADNSSNKGRPEFLSAREAKRFALQGFNHRRWAFPKELSGAISGAKPGEPLLVERLNRKGRFYYIVPFYRNRLATVLVNIDARTGAFEETSYFQKPAVYPAVNRKQAETIMSAYFKKQQLLLPVVIPPPALVWEPCEQTQSPDEPLWRFRINSQDWFVAQTGMIFDRIEPFKLKGGGPQ